MDSSPKKKNRIGDIFLKAGKISQSQLDASIEAQKKKGHLLGETMAELGFVSYQDVAFALSKQLHIPYIELKEDFKLGQAEIRLIPEAIARKFCITPFKREKNSITIVMKDPLDIEAVDTVRRLTNLEVRRGVNSEENIRAIIDKYYREEERIESDLQDIVDLENGKSEENGREEEVDAEQLRMLANDAPVVRFVNLLLLQAVRDRASDIHFEPSERDVAIRLRVDGILRQVTPPPKSLYQAIVTRIKILAKMNIAERRLPQDGRFKFKVKDRIIDVRVSSLPEASAEKLVLRILDRQALLINMEDLGFESEMLERFRKNLKNPNGIILLTGPTGSGKTTTLYGALNYLKSPAKNIQTVEDPIEYLIKGINQMQIKPDIGLTFASALRSILRQDPDIIMIGEIRDYDTASIAIRAATTGHLVLSTLHTNDATSAFSRLRDIGIEPYLIAATVSLVISQRLVRVICKRCKEKITLPAESLQLIESVYPDASKWTYYHGAGCRDCSQTGYMGRTSIYEFLEVTELLKEIVSIRADEGALRKKAIDMGMMTLLASGFSKIKQGITTIEEVLGVCPTPLLED